MKKIKTNRLIKSIITIAIMISIISIPNIKAQTNMKIDKKSYIHTGTRKEAKFHTNKGYAYCITPHRTGPGQGSNLSYKKEQHDGGILYLLEKTGTSNSEYLATQLAIWKYKDNYMPKFYRNHGNYSVVKRAKALAKEAQKNKDYKGKETTIKINTNDSQLKLTSDGKYYQSSEMKITIKESNFVNLSVEDAPKNTRIIDSNFKQISKVGNQEIFYIQIPYNQIEESSSVKIVATTTGKVSTIERYSKGNNKWQDLIILVKKEKIIKETKILSVSPVIKICEENNGIYYDKSGKQTDKINYEIQCKKHTCEKVGDIYFGNTGEKVTEEEYTNQCSKHSCEIINNKYYDREGNIVSQAEYKSQCEAQIVPVPDTNITSTKHLIYIIIGSAIIGITSGIIETSKERKNNYNI